MMALMKNGALASLMAGGATVRTAFCGPCFGAGDVPANGSLSIRHTTRNFPSREGSKPGSGQIAGVALMDARTIAATTRNGGIDVYKRQALTGAAGEKLDDETRDRMWKQFIGDSNALRSLKALFESKGMYTKEMEKYIFSAESWCDELESLAIDFKIQPGTNLNQAVTFGRKLEKFCELEGVELDKPFIQYLNAEDYSQFCTEQLKAAFGI